jgi:uncharacterized protein YkwD
MIRLTAASLALLLLGFQAIAQEEPPTIPKSVMEKLHQVALLTNRERAKEGLAPLKMNGKLIAAAMAHAKDMAQRNYFDHRSPDGDGPGERTKREGYTQWSGENIYLGPTTPKEAVDGWMDSPGHKKNILTERSKEIGVGYAVSSKRTSYWVQVFGAPEKEFPVIINQEAWSTDDVQVHLYLYGRGKAQSYRIKNEGKEFTDWRPFESNVAWELEPGEGTRTVVVELRGKGGETVTVQDEIQLKPKAAVSDDRRKANPPPRPQ